MVQDLAAAEHARALGTGIGELRRDGIGLRAEDEGSDRARMDVRPVGLDALRLRDELLDEGREDATVDIDAFEALTGLAGGETRGAQRDIGGALEVGARGDDQRIVAAEFEERRHEMPRRVLGDLAAGGDAAREADDIRGGDELLTGLAAARLQAEHGGELGYGGDALHRGDHETRCDLARLDEHRATGEQRRHGIDEAERNREVPGADDAHQRIRHILGAIADGGQRRGTEVLFLRKSGRCPAPTIDHAEHGLELADREQVPTGVGGERRDDLGLARQPFRAPAAEHLDAMGERRRGPRRLCRSQPREHRRQRGGRRGLETMIGQSGARIADGERLRRIGDCHAGHLAAASRRCKVSMNGWSASRMSSAPSAAGATHFKR